MSFQAYLFDLDGTLIDSVRLILDSFHHTPRVHFGDQIEESVYIESMGTPLVVGADDVKRAKPDPEPVHLALRSLQIDPMDAVFIGDSPHDIHSGNAAKVITGAASWGPFTRDALAVAEPKHWLTHPLQVLSLTR